MLYDKYCELCKLKDVAPTTAAKEAGISKSTVTKWKNNPDTTITANILKRLAAYFQMSPYELMQFFDDSKEMDEVENGEQIAGLTEDEAILIQLFRLLPTEQQNAAINMIKSLATSQGLL